MPVYRRIMFPLIVLMLPATAVFAYIRVPKQAADRPGAVPAASVSTSSLSTCPACHDLVAKAVRSSAHGRAGLDCISCHSFSTHRDANPGAFLEKRFYAMATEKVCARCHGVVVKQWRDGRHINPLNILFDRLNPFLPNDPAFHNPLTLKVKMANPCMICHEPHAFKPGVDRRARSTQE